MSGHGNTNGNLEYSSIIVWKNLFLEFDGTGPLKSRFNRSKGCVAFIREAAGGTWNFGLHSRHMEQLLTTFCTSSTEKGKFLLRINAKVRVIPG